MTYSSDIITIVRDPRHVLGKRFISEPDGKIRKEPAVSISFAEAVQRHVPDVQALHDVFSEVAEDSHAAIINSAFPLIPGDQPFLILSEREFQTRGVDRHDSNVQWPVDVEYQGKNWPALGRFTELTAPSSWILLDRDVDEHTPAEYAYMNYEEWLQSVDMLIPGILDCARLRAHSASARVSVAGVPVGGGNGHTWVQIQNPEDIERLRSVVKARAIAMGMAWTKPKRSRSTGEIVANDVASIIDWSVFTKGRLVFVGKPGVENAI